MQIQGNEEAGYDLIGNLTYDTVPNLFRQGLIGGLSSTSLNLDKVERVDSAGLALLVEWYYLVRARNKELILKNVPAPLKSLIEVSGLKEILLVSDQ